MTDDDAATILLVEDDDATRTFLADNLTADGYELLVADCVSDGLRLLERKFPDLALVDLGLPDASGYELLRRVRRADGVVEPRRPDTPLIVLSGALGELDRVRGFERGADDYVCKPFSYPELRGRVAALLRRADRRPRAAPARRRARGRPAVARGAPARRRASSCRRRSSRCCARSSATRRACSPRTSCCARSGATARPARRARWTRTPAGCGRSSASHGDRFVVNVWGVGYRLVDGRVAAAVAGTRLGRDRICEMRSSRGANFARRALYEVRGLAARGANTRSREDAGHDHDDGSGGRVTWMPALAWALRRRGSRWRCVRVELRRRRELVARACHELRGPLTAVRLSLATMERRARRRPSAWPCSTSSCGAPAWRWTTSPRRAAAGATVDRTEPVEVAELLEEQFESWHVVAGAFDSYVTLGELLPGALVHGDRLRLAQAVSNLVANALEHGPGRVELAAREVGQRQVASR